LLLALDNPLGNPNTTFNKVLYMVDTAFTMLFLAEAIVKIIAFGFICTSLKKPQQPYLFVAWNVLDFLVVVASVADFIISFDDPLQSGGALKSLKALRALRALRPLRMISRNEGLKLVVNSLFSSLPALGNVMLVCGMFVLIFAIMGINIFKGKFYHCEISEDKVE